MDEYDSEVMIEVDISSDDPIEIPEVDVFAGQEAEAERYDAEANGQPEWPDGVQRMEPTAGDLSMFKLSIEHTGGIKREVGKFEIDWTRVLESFRE